MENKVNLEERKAKRIALIDYLIALDDVNIEKDQQIYMYESKVMVNVINRLKKILSTMDSSIVTSAFESQIEELESRYWDCMEKWNIFMTTEEEKRECRNIYRRILEKVSPDLYTKITTEQLSIYHEAEKAYYMSDLRTLKQLVFESDGLVFDNNIEVDQTRLLTTADEIKHMLDETSNPRLYYETLDYFTESMIKLHFPTWKQSFCDEVVQALGKIVKLYYQI